MKGILSVVASVFIGFIIVSVILFAFKITWVFLSLFKSMLILGLVAAFAIPSYLVIRKKLFS
jgi:hypothetical protein